MKFTKYMVWLPLMVVAYLFNTSTIKAQELSIIRLLDKESSLPIIGATYIYSDQNGISDKAGDIKFRYEPGSEMSISHVSYGKWKLSGPQVPAAIGSQVIYRQRTIVNLYPVTVIALRTSKKPTEKVEMDYQERLAHDAAQILNQSPGLNSIRKSGNYGFDPVFRGFKYDQLNIVLH